MQLRDYQQSALTAINTAALKGIQKQLAVLATGMGKTVIFSHLISERVKQTKKKALIIAHREELLLQAKEKLQRVNPMLRIGIEQAEKTADHLADDVIIASVPTIGRSNSSRLAAFRPETFSTIIIDEAHHASAESYKTILAHFCVLKNHHDTNKNILLLGVTATPNRNDNQGIDQIFDHVVFNYTIVDGIKDGWLSRIKAVKIQTKTDVTSVKSIAGDFALDELQKTVNTPERNALVVQTYHDLALNKQTLVFATDVAHTKDLAAAFIQAGYKASYITGDTDKSMREESLRKFANKEIHIMVNAMVLTEGYDNASIEFIFMTRPTQSALLYQQMIGRGTRLHTDKTHLMIVDFVDNTTKHTLQTAASLLGLNGTIDFQGEDILDMKSKLDLLLEKRPYINTNTLKVKDIDYLVKEVDLLQEKTLAKQEENYTWHKFGSGMRMHNGRNRYFFVEQSLTGEYMLYEFLRIIQKKKTLGTFVSQAEAMRYADAQIVNQYSGNALPVSWAGSSSPSYPGQDLPSEAQIALLRELGVDEQTIMFLDKRSASQMISERKRSR